MAQFIIAPEAIRDLDGISDYFVIHNIVKGNRDLESLFDGEVPE